MTKQASKKNVFSRSPYLSPITKDFLLQHLTTVLYQLISLLDYCRNSPNWSCHRVFLPLPFNVPSSNPGRSQMSSFYPNTKVCEVTSLVVQWLRRSTPNAGGPGSIPSQGTRSHMPQLKDPTCCKEDPCRINKY